MASYGRVRLKRIPEGGSGDWDRVCDLKEFFPGCGKVLCCVMSFIGETENPKCKSGFAIRIRQWLGEMLVGVWLEMGSGMGVER